MNDQTIKSCARCGREFVPMESTRDCCVRCLGRPEDQWADDQLKNLRREVAQYRDAANAAIAALKELRDELHHTADGEVAIEGRTGYTVEPDFSVYQGTYRWWGVRGPAKLILRAGFRNRQRIWIDKIYKPHECYSTREAAEAEARVRAEQERPRP